LIRRLSGLTAVVLLLGASQCALPKRQFLIVNTATRGVSLGVSCDGRRTWLPQVVDTQARLRYQCDSPKDHPWIHLNTDLSGEPHQEAESELKPGERYEVYFDQVAKKWNIRPM
jgi:hypothetical protein